MIGEATALFIAGLLLDGIGEANTWRDFGADLLIQEAERQILDDGVHCELWTLLVFEHWHRAFVAPHAHLESLFSVDHAGERHRTDIGIASRLS